MHVRARLLRHRGCVRVLGGKGVCMCVLGCSGIGGVCVYWEARVYACACTVVQRVCVCVCMGVCSVAQACLTLCDPMNCGLPGSSVRGISQARIPE